MKRMASIVGLMLVASQAVANDNKPSITSQVDRNRCFEGESIRLLVTVNNVAAPTAPEIESTPDLAIELVGQTRMAQATISIVINGRQMQNTSNQGVQYQYRVTPLKAGRLKIPPAVATVDGVRIEGRPIPIQVTGASEQDQAILEITVDHTTVYPLQPFTVTLKVFLKALPGRLAKTDPTHTRLERLLTVPWAVDRGLPANLVTKEDLDKWLGPLQRRDGWGFEINKLGSPGIFAMLGNDASTFELPSKRVRRADRHGKETDYWEYTLARTFVPKSVGEFGFGPATLKGRFATGPVAPDSEQFNLEEIFAVAPRLVVTVRGVPEEGRPAEFTGAIGSFRFEADLTPRKAKVGDPMTLTLTLAGKGLLDTAGAPDLERVPQVAERFRVYDATEETKGDAREFTYSIRPKSVEVTEFPAVPIAYFDVNKEAYVTEYSRPIPIEVTAADQVRAGEIVGAARLSGAGEGETIETSREGIFGNRATAANLTDERVEPARWFGSVVGLAAAYGLLAVGAARVRAWNADPAARRRAGAARKATQRVAEGKELAAAGQTRAAADLFRAAACGLIADALHIEESGLTPKDARERAIELGAEQCADGIARLLERCDGARYAGAAAVEADLSLAEEAERVVVGLVEVLKTKGRLR